MRKFAIGAIVALLIFLAANLLAAQMQSDCGLRGLLGVAGCADDISRAGFPFIFWEQGGFAFHQFFGIGAFLADIAVGVAFCLAAGWAAQRWWPQR